MLNRKDDRGAQYLTIRGVEHLKNELKRQEQEHPGAVDDVARLAELGDFSENAEYQDAKYRLRRINDRITSLKERIKHVVVIEEGGSESGKIEIGSTVIVKVNELERTYQIVGPAESSPARGRISYLSPLGSALLDHQPGEKVELPTDHGLVIYEILEVK